VVHPAPEFAVSLEHLGVNSKPTVHLPAPHLGRPNVRLTALWKALGRPRLHVG